jgi:hypothetical protein
VAAQLKMKPAADHSQHEQNELKTIGEQIAKAETNLALASTPADFKTVSGVLSQLRDREAALRDKLSKANRKLADLSPEIMKAVQQLKNARNILIDWPNIGDADDRAQLLRDLAVVFKMTISSIVLRTDLMPSAAAYGLKDFKRRTGVLSFNSEHITADDAVLTDAMLSHPFRRQYRKIADHLRDFGAPATERDLAAHIGKSDVRAVTRALLACEVDGLVKKTETGWVLSH